MKEFKVGDVAPQWSEVVCECCGDEFYLTCRDSKVIKDGDLTCSDCKEYIKHQDELDSLEKEIEKLKADVSEFLVAIRKIEGISGNRARIPDYVKDIYHIADDILKKHKGDYDVQ